MTGQKRTKDELFDVLRREIFAAEMKVALDKQLGRPTSDIVKKLAAVKLPPATGSASGTTRTTESVSGTTKRSGSVSATTMTTALFDPGPAKVERPRRRYRPSTSGRHLEGRAASGVAITTKSETSDVETLDRTIAS